MADNKLEEDLLNHNYHYELCLVNYKDFGNSTGSPLAYFTIPVNRTLFFFPPQKEVTVCAWGYYNVNILPTLVL